MTGALRAAAAAFAGLSGFVITVVPLLVLLPEAVAGLVSSSLALLAGVFTGIATWRRTESQAAGLGPSLVLGALIGGGAGFALGFFGPMVFAPGANQGPMLGIFITGPLGLPVGALIGAFLWQRRRRGRATR
jgi:hypothetical protein